MQRRWLAMMPMPLEPIEAMLPRAVTPLGVGITIAGRYRIQNRIGGGAMGEVWGGSRLDTGARVAIKTLHPSGNVDHQMIARFRREALLLERVHSDHVARVLEFLSDETYGLLLVMELVDGVPLAQLLSGERRLSVEEAVEIAADLAQGLCDLHRVHVVHRDLKPANVILTIKGARRCAVLVDFGAGRMLSAGGDRGETLTAMTCAGMAIGTMEYMAPEQVLSSRDVTPACDVYALGALIYRCVAGSHIYGNNLKTGQLLRAKLFLDAPPLETGRTDAVARGLEAIVARALRRERSERYPSAMELATDLATLRAEELPFPLVRRRRPRMLGMTMDGMG